MDWGGYKRFFLIKLKVYSTLCVLCETFVHFVVKIFNHKEHHGFTKDTKRRVHRFLLKEVFSSTIRFQP